MQHRITIQPDTLAAVDAVIKRSYQPRPQALAALVEDGLLLRRLKALVEHSALGTDHICLTLDGRVWRLEHGGRIYVGESLEVVASAAVSDANPRQS